MWDSMSLVHLSCLYDIILTVLYFDHHEVPTSRMAFNWLSEIGVSSGRTTRFDVARETTFSSDGRVYGPGWVNNCRARPASMPDTDHSSTRCATRAKIRAHIYGKKCYNRRHSMGM